MMNPHNTIDNFKIRPFGEDQINSDVKVGVVSKMIE